MKRWAQSLNRLTQPAKDRGLHMEISVFNRNYRLFLGESSALQGKRSLADLLRSPVPMKSSTLYMKG
jgi:hypothetical protein